MTEAEAAMQLGQAIALLVTTVAAVPTVIAAPVVAIISLGSFLFGKKYERKWNKRKGVYEPYHEPIPYEVETPREQEMEQ